MENLTQPKLSRRKFVQRSMMAGAATSLLPGTGQAAKTAPPAPAGPNLYEQIGVRPLINAKGTYTIISGSLSLPEVKQAMEEAGRHYVNMDELMAAVGARLAKITGAEWGIVTAGCAAAITGATAACIAGTDPEKSQKMPYMVKGGLKSQVIIPKHSRNPYDVGSRLLGVDVVEVETPEQLAASMGPQTAMIYILSSPSAASGPLSIANICRAAKGKNIPVFVDAAAENLIIPNIHLAAGATLVGYSGGKCMRGPQCAGLLLGRKDLVQAAWFQAAPHHNVGRSLKVGKEEIMGMLTAVEMWTKRDHDAEWNTWKTWLGTIEAKVKPLPSVTTEYLMPEDLSNHSPRLRVKWDGNALKITGDEMAKTSGRRHAAHPVRRVERKPSRRDGKFRDHHALHDDARRRPNSRGCPLRYSLPSPMFSAPEIPRGAPANVAGIWKVQMKYLCGEGGQRFLLEQQEGIVTGVHQGEIYNGNLTGKVHAQQVSFRSVMPVGGNEIEYSFAGSVAGNSMSGTVELGEYGHAQWSATRETS